MADLPDNVIDFVKMAKELHPSSDPEEAELVDADPVDRKCFIVLPRHMWENEFIGFRDVSTHVPHVMVASARGGLRGVPVVFTESLEFEPIFTT